MDNQYGYVEEAGGSRYLVSQKDAKDLIYGTYYE